MFNKEMVRLRRLELPRVINPQRPQRCASTNSATAAPYKVWAAAIRQAALSNAQVTRTPRLYPTSGRFNQALFQRP